MEFAEVGMLGLALLTGLGVGIVFYMGLWWTILKFSKKHLMLWWWGSFIIRIMIALFIFYLVAEGHLARYVLILLGFIVSRKIVLKIKPLA